MVTARNLTMAELEAGLGPIRASPPNCGVVKLIVRRPRIDAREELAECRLDPAEGLVGDRWSDRGSSRTPKGSPHPGMQLTIMNSRAIDLIARQKDRWQLAGDQLFIDLDLSAANVPPGTRIVIGSAEIEVSDQPHTGCTKFVARFGLDAMKFVNSDVGRQLNLRGINATVIKAGVIRIGDIATKCDRRNAADNAGTAGAVND